MAVSNLLELVLNPHCYPGWYQRIPAVYDWLVQDQPFVHTDRVDVPRSSLVHIQSYIIINMDVYR